MAKPDDDLLENYLAGSSEVSALYRGMAAETTPPQLDAHILAAARRELRPRRGRWALPLAMAAALVLCVSVVLQLPPERTTPAIGTAALQRDAGSKTLAAPAAESAPSLETSAKKAEPTAQRAAGKNLASPAAKPQAPAMMDAPAAAPSLAAPVRDEAIRSRDAAEFAAPAPAAVPTMPSEHRGAAQAAKAAAAAGSGELQTPVPSPAAWIARIRKLRGDGDDAQARREIEALRAHYPDYVLPPDLSTPAP